MSPEEKRVKITRPIALDQALKIYGVNSENELMKILKDKLSIYGKQFLLGKTKKKFWFF
tara:strand:+ start:1303 stop:1479 length:177 start_codon:yes stop_codon:yes gene_type:complete